MNPSFSLLLAGLVMAFSQASAASDNPELMYLDPYINGEKKDAIVPVVMKGDEIWLGQSALPTLRIDMGALSKSPQEFFDESFVPVPSEFSPRIDLANLSFYLNVAEEYLPLSVVKHEVVPVTPNQSELGFYWNYLLMFLHEPFQSRAIFYSQHKAVVTSKYGVLTNTFLTRSGHNSGLVRLSNYYTVDFPTHNLFLTVGDFFTNGLSWSSSIPMLGIHLEKSYKYVPNFLSYPTLELEGALKTQGDIEIRVRNAKYLTKSLPMGRFYLDNPALPVGSHLGELVVRDAQGVARVVPFSYYIDSSILRPGLSTYSYGLGLVRKNYGLESFDYKEAVFAMRHKWGVTNFWTPEVHFQASLNSMLLGSDQRFRLFNWGSLRLSSAINYRDEAVHPLLGVDFLLDKYDINFRTSAEVAFPYYQALGLSLPVSKDFRYLLHSHFKIDKDYLRHTSLNHSFIRNQYFRQNVFSIMQSLPISSQWHVNINAYYDTFSRGFGVFALLTLFLDRHSVNFDVEADRSLVRTSSQYHFSTTSTAGNRYRVAGGLAYDKMLHSYAHAGMESQYFQGALQVNTHNRSLSYGAQIEGALGCLASTCFAAKPIEHGFALVQVPKQKDVTITKEFGGILGKTDSRGNLVVTNLLPYQPVKIQALTRDLDPRVSTEQLEKSITIAPSFHTAHRVKFLAPLIRRIIFRLVREGRLLSEGGSISVEGVMDDGFIGGEGLVYLEIPEKLSVIHGRTVTGACSFTIDLPNPSDDIIEDLGKVECQ